MNFVFYSFLSKGTSNLTPEGNCRDLVWSYSKYHMYIDSLLTKERLSID